MAPEAATAKRVQKDLDRLETKTDRLARKLAKLEEKHSAGKLKPERFHAKKMELKTALRGYDKTIRTLKGKLGKAKAAGVVR